MADNQWMYSGFIRRNRVTSEWIVKTDVYLKEIFRRPMRIIPPCPCARCARRHRRNQTDMSEHLRTHGYMPNFDMPPINIAEQDRGREEVMRQRIDGYEDDGVRDMLDVSLLQKRQMRHLQRMNRRSRRQPQRPSWRSWPRRRNLFMRVRKYLSWMPSRN